RVFFLRAGQLLGMDDGLVDRAAGGSKIGKLGVDAVALQDIDGRERLAADPVGGGARDDRPVDASRPGPLLDVVEAAADQRLPGPEPDGAGGGCDCEVAGCRAGELRGRPQLVAPPPDPQPRRVRRERASRTGGRGAAAGASPARDGYLVLRPAFSRRYPPAP